MLTLLSRRIARGPSQARNQGLAEFQTTVADTIEVSGIGVHSGKEVALQIHPAEAHSGIRFQVTKGTAVVGEIPAHVSKISNLQLCTVISDESGASAATIEHLMAALRALGVDNALVELDACEVPILDGSSAVFVEAIRETGLKRQSARRRYIKVLKPIRVQEGTCWGELLPNADGFRVDVEIDFPCATIGRQRIALDVTAESFATELSRARTFGFMDDVEKLWSVGRALGASLENTVALKDDRVLNPEGLRFADEFVRHKALDAVGDLALAGLPLLATYRSYKGGHKLNAMVLTALLADPDAWTVVEMAGSEAALPARETREPALADAGLAMAHAMMAPERN